MVMNTHEDANQRRVAFTKLMLIHEGDILRAARRLCRGNDDWAQDLTQDALIRAYEAYRDGRFQEGTHPRPWLIRILTNLFINEYNRRQRWDAGVDVDTLTSGGEAGPAQTHIPKTEIPGVGLVNAILDEELEMALAALPEPLRVCIMLVDVEGLEYAEAAEALSIPIGTVRSRLARARMKLEDLLADWARRNRLRP
jgi:RNA polymerase sigma-70 factor (ECF subfamily)